MRRLTVLHWIGIGEAAARRRRERKREKRKNEEEEKRSKKQVKRRIKKEEIERRQLMISLRLLWLLRREGVRRRHRCGEMFLLMFDFLNIFLIKIF